MIKIMNLKGYEYELYEAHESGVRELAFIPNQGILISVDSLNELAVWNLRELDEEPFRTKIPVAGKVLCNQLYAPSFISNEPDNH